MPPAPDVPSALRSSAAERKAAQLARINELSQLARTAWFSLLGYLAFVGITLLGVTDADFFVPSRQTQLPLANVSIPTASFFLVAPVLGAALYTYLHLFLIKLWDAHVPPTGDAAATHHWLVGDFVLIRQRDPVTRARPLSWLIAPVTWLLVWAAGPIVLGYAWWRSMPAHNEWLTLLIAACFWLSLVVGIASWLRSRECLRSRRPRRWTGSTRRGAAVIGAILLIAVSWLRTEGGLDRYIEGAWTLDAVTSWIPEYPPTLAWLRHIDLTLSLARTDLADANLVPLPDSWRSAQAAQAAFRKIWCDRQGLAMTVCDQPADLHYAPPMPVRADRTVWCEDNGALSEDACTDHFTDLDRQFVDAWKGERGSARAALPTLDLHGRDLRRVQATRASLIGAILSGAQMETADLSLAQMEGADLSGTHMEGAGLSWAQMEEANLSGAHMERAGLSGTQLERANLSKAHLDGAYLSGARMEGADLFQAQMEGANLSGALMGGAYLSGAQMKSTNLSGAQMEGADLSGAHMEGANLGEAQMKGAGLSGARMEGAGLSGAQLEGADLFGAQMQKAVMRGVDLSAALMERAAMQGADLSGAQMERTDLFGAQMEAADLSGAQMEAADLREANLRKLKWTGASNRASLAHFADLRGAQDLTQAQLDDLIGNGDTLLPEGNAPDTGLPFHVWSCWDKTPKGFDALVQRIADRQITDRFLCSREPPYETGTPMPVDAPYPPDHPLARGN